MRDHATDGCRAVAGAAPDDQMQRLAAHVALHTLALDCAAQELAAVQACLVCSNACTSTQSFAGILATPGNAAASMFMKSWLPAR